MPAPPDADPVSDDPPAEPVPEPASARVALVTGASSGIGWALARVLALEEGYAVGLVARRAERLELLAGEIRDAGGLCATATADVGDRDAMRRAVEAVTRALGPVDLFVANAGVARDTSALAPDVAGFELEVRTNLLGAFYGIEAVVPGMVTRGGGHVVAISSLAARRGFPGSGGYCATKIALTRLMESLRLDWKAAGIHATTVHPGFVKSEITARQDRPLPFLMDAEPAARRIARAIRLRRKRCDFPWPTALLSRVAALLPDALLLRLHRRSDPSG